MRTERSQIGLRGPSLRVAVGDSQDGEPCAGRCKSGRGPAFTEKLRRGRLPQSKTLARSRSASRGFTLIEMLVVIAIIGILAGLIIAALPGIQNKKIQSRVRTELTAIETAINSYKAAKSVLPPDNQKNNPSLPPLFYELTGTTNDATRYYSLMVPADAGLAKPVLNGIFGIDGFFNSSTEKEEVKNFFSTLRPAQTGMRGPGAATGGAGQVRVLVAPYKGVDGQLAVWNYNSSNPVHNPGDYDLWVELVIGGKKVIIGNWKD